MDYCIGTFSLFLFVSFLSLTIIVNEQKQKIFNNFYQQILVDTKRLSYAISTVIDRDEKVQLNAILDEEVAINPLFQSLSITQVSSILSNTHRKGIIYSKQKIFFL